MKVLARPIDMLCWFDKTGMPHPIRFRAVADDESEMVIMISKVVSTEKEKLAGNDMLLFKCQGVINNVLKIFELKYELRTCKWFLFKM